MERYRIGNNSVDVSMFLQFRNSAMRLEAYNRALDTIPAEPMPEIARPMMKQLEDGATPDRSDPSSKIKIAHRNTHLTEQKLHSFP